MAMNNASVQAQGQAVQGQAQPPGARADMAPLLQQLNFASIRTRTQDLHSALSRIIHSFHTNPSLKWSEVLGQFAIVNMELLNLVEDIKPMLKVFVAYPKSVNVENAPILPIMLSSKLLPEMEVEESMLRDKLLSGLSNLSLPAQSEYLQKKIEMVRSACDIAEKVLADTRKVYGLGTRQGPVSFPTMEKAHTAKVIEQEKLLRNAANYGEGLRISPDQRQVSGSLPQHLAPSFAMGDSAPSSFQVTDSGSGLPKTPTSVALTTGFVRSGGTQQGPQAQLGSIPSPLQALGGATINGTPPSAMSFTNSPRSGNFNASSPQQQSQQQQNQAALLQRQKVQQLQKQQQALQQLRQPATPPLPHAQILNHQPGVVQQSIMQPQQAKLQQLQQSPLQQLHQQQQAQFQQHIQAQQERQFQLQIQQQQQHQQMQNAQLQPLQQGLGQNPLYQSNAMKPQLGQLAPGTGNSLFGNTQSSMLTSNMIANLTQSGHPQALLQQRLQFGAGLNSSQSQRNLSSQMLTEPLYMGLPGGTQVSAGLGPPLQQLGSQSNYSSLLNSNQTNLLNSNQTNLLNTTQTNLLNASQNNLLTSSQSSLLDPGQNSLLSANQNSLLNAGQSSLLGSNQNCLLNANQNSLMNSSQNSLLNAGQNMAFGQRQQAPP
ncbi:hypothetical protein O6H91_18G010100 [Diphasiastrum complanatum]|uniref:Uncharacterized protein n=2 Tax=Diphasiastrum complanatum TaxID=34168 RepID=A0ACC2AY82_DIPCM|nr:hypothetical protein O6H91_18G010100 [Diphasiastrum complanatum]KAJ7522427.1 hypothetical protein O6H91_18G010100 [Diphasiastrum complanatum]